MCENKYIQCVQYKTNAHEILETVKMKIKNKPFQKLHYFVYNKCRGHQILRTWERGHGQDNNIQVYYFLSPPLK